MADAASIEYTHSTCFSPNSTAPRHLKPIMFIESKEEFEWPQFRRCPNVLRIFSLSFRWVLPASSAFGPRLPRQYTAACGSPERPRCHCPAAHRGHGSSGCAEHQRPWPRTKDFGEENLLEAMGSLHEEVDEMLMVQFFPHLSGEGC